MSNTFQIASDCAVRVLNEELKLTPKETHLSVYQLIIQLRLNYRLFFLSHEMVTTEIWPLLRADNDLMEVLIRASVSFYAELCDGGYYKELCVVLGGAYGGLSGKTVTDESFHDKISDETKLVALFRQEHWLAFLVVLERNASRVLDPKLLTTVTEASNEETARRSG